MDWPPTRRFSAETISLCCVVTIDGKRKYLELGVFQRVASNIQLLYERD
jgi:hypothetical protein